MMKLMGAKRKDRDKVASVESDKKWWKFSRKTKVKPMRALDIQHNVKFNENHDGGSECYEMSKYVDRDNNHYRYGFGARRKIFHTLLISKVRGANHVTV